MSNSKGVSHSVIRRLPRYYRFLSDLLRSGVTRISSRKLSELMGITASQIRQDLNCFGGFGQQGYGYNVEQLHEEIAHILGLNRDYKAILLGAGNLGRAIATHMSFETKGFRLIGVFDNNSEIIGETVRDLQIRHTDELSSFCASEKPEAAILCIPKGSAQRIADYLVSLGIKGFWNFSHYDLSVNYPGITVENVHLGDSLMTLCFKVFHVSEEAALSQEEAAPCVSSAPVVRRPAAPVPEPAGEQASGV